MFVLRDTTGGAMMVEVVCMSRTEVVLEARGSVSLPPPPPLHLVLVQGVGKGDRFEQVLQHGTEMGVSTFVPLISRRAVRRPAYNGRDGFLERWQRILIGATEQARREAVPHLCRPMSLPEAVESVREQDGRFVLHPDACTRLSPSDAPADGRHVALFVGPEGGFDREELEFLEDHDILPRSIGPYVLRTETAALAAVAVLLFGQPVS